MKHSVDFVLYIQAQMIVSKSLIYLIHI